MRTQFDWWGAERRVQSEAHWPEPARSALDNPHTSTLNITLIGVELPPLFLPKTGMRTQFDWWGEQSAGFKAKLITQRQREELDNLLLQVRMDE
jgi:hypothetical protein